MLQAQIPFPFDDVRSINGTVRFYFIKHASLIMESRGKIIYVDPIGNPEVYKKCPKADLILITHLHSDHFDTLVIDQITKPSTKLVVSPTVFDILKRGVVLKNWDYKSVDSVLIKAVPAYNTTKDRDKFHPKGRDNGYVIKFGGLNIYIAGDTEDIPEMAELTGMDVAFLPMNQPYTMTPEQVARVARVMMPKILYPYHTGETNVAELSTLLKDLPKIDLRIRAMQ